MKEKLSAMLDGDVDEATARALFNRLKCDTAFRDDWETYCLLGDVIRNRSQPDMEGFVARVMARLENEPTVFVPHRKEPGARGTAHHFLRQHLMPVAASVMGVLAVGGVVATLSGGAAVPIQVAEVPPQAVTVAPAAQRAPGNARYDYLVAHQAIAGGPMPAAVQYVRTVSMPVEE